MKNITLILLITAASAVAGAGLAFSGSGPFGAFGPADYTVKTQDDLTHKTALNPGTGPYGAFAVVDRGPAVLSKVAATPGGSGPFGAFASYGMLPGSKLTTKDDCIVLAKNCSPER